MKAFDSPVGAALDAVPAPANLGVLLADLPYADDDVVVVSDTERLTLGELRERVAELATVLGEAGVESGHPVGCLVSAGPAPIVVMFAAWAVGGVYIPINRRYTPAEVSAFISETPVALICGEPEDLARYEFGIGAVSYEYTSRTAQVLSPARPSTPKYDPDIALVLRTSGTTGRPKAVLLRHSGTLDAVDASLHKLRSRSGERSRPAAVRAVRMNLIPVYMATWAGVFNTLFSLRAGFGVVLLDRFTPQSFAAAVRAYGITSTVLAPAMITMLTDAEDLADLGPMRLVRSITAPLSPEAARQFHDRFGAVVLNSYGQTELGGEVVGWTTEDLRQFGTTKLGAAGRPYDHIDLRIRRPDGSDAGTDEAGEILVLSPFRMRGYALADGRLDEAADERFVDGYLRTGDIGRLDAEGFLWVDGRVSDMINRGGLKVFPDEVEEVLRRHPQVRDAGVAAVPDRRLGEVPHAWVVTQDGFDLEELGPWCREELAPYKVPTGFTRVESLPRSEIGKLLRRQLSAQFS